MHIDGVTSLGSFRTNKNHQSALQRIPTLTICNRNIPYVTLRCERLPCRHNMQRILVTLDPTARTTYGPNSVPNNGLHH